MPADIKSHERIQLKLAELAFDKDDFETVEKVLQLNFCTIREGETTLSDMWYGLRFKEESKKLGRELTEDEKQQYVVANDPPKSLDFRMMEPEPTVEKQVI